MTGISNLFLENFEKQHSCIIIDENPTAVSPILIIN